MSKEEDWTSKEYYDEDDIEIQELSASQYQKLKAEQDSEERGEGLVRLQKALAGAGVASRRACEDLITMGQVKVNGKLVTELGSKIDPAKDKVTVRGVPVQFDADKVYLAFNKPKGVISSMSDDAGRVDLSGYVTDYDRVFNVGRLDADTTGLLLLTNDGELANQLAHPSFGVEKTYIAKVQGDLAGATVQSLKTGIELEDGLIAADRIRVMSQSNGQTMVEVVLHSGRNRIVRRMFEAVGHPVVELVRKQFGPIQLGALKSGAVRQLSKIEVGALMKIASGQQNRAPRPPKQSKPRRNK